MAGSGARTRWETWALLIPVVMVLAGYVAYPSLRIVYESLWRDGTLTLANYIEFFSPSERANLEALAGSVLISLGSAVLAGIVGTALATIFTLYDFPGRNLCASLAILPIALPPLVGVLAFFFLYGETGLFPRGIQALFGLAKPPFAVDGVPAIFLVHTYTMYVYFYLLVSSGLAGLDSSILEAARSLGASRWATAWRVVLPLLTPALVGASLLVFMTSMASFSAPYIFAGATRILALQIYISKINGDWAMAVTQTVVLAAVSLAFLILMRWYMGRTGYAMAQKGAARPRRPIQSGVGRALAGVFGVALVVVLILPHAAVVLLSFVKNGTWTHQILPPEYTLENYRLLFADPRIATPIFNSLKMASLATAANFAFGLFAAYLLATRRFRGRWAVDLLVMVPWALPGTVIAMNLIVAFSRPTVPSFGAVLVGTFWILPLAYFVRQIPLVVRAMAAALAQLDPSLEEAARGLGASWWISFRRVVLPLVMPSALAGALLSFVASLGEFVSSVLLYVYDNRPISIEILAQLRMFNFGSAAAYGTLLIGLIILTLIVSRRVLRAEAGSAFA